MVVTTTNFKILTDAIADIIDAKKTTIILRDTTEVILPNVIFSSPEKMIKTKADLPLIFIENSDADDKDSSFELDEVTNFINIYIYDTDKEASVAFSSQVFKIIKHSKAELRAFNITQGKLTRKFMKTEKFNDINVNISMLRFKFKFRVDKY